MMSNSDSKVSAEIDKARALVDTHVLESIRWYQSKKSKPRNFYRISTTITVAGGSLISLAAFFDSNIARAITGATGFLVAVFGSLGSTFNWSVQWQTFTRAQTELEFAVADWEIELRSIESSPDPDDIKIERIWGSTRQLLSATRAVRDRELDGYFQVLDTPGGRSETAIRGGSETDQ